MRTALYLQNEITRLDVLSFCSLILALLGVYYKKFFGLTTAELLATCLCALVAMILTPLAIRQKFKPFYVFSEEGFFQRGIFSKYEAGTRGKGGRIFSWQEIESFSSEYRTETEVTPWLMIILDSGVNVYFPTAGFYDDPKDEDTLVSPDNFIATFKEYYELFGNKATN